MSADLPKIRNWNREQQAQRIAELEQQRDELLAAAIKVNALSIQTDAHRELRAAIAKVKT